MALSNIQFETFNGSCPSLDTKPQLVTPIISACRKIDNVLLIKVLFYFMKILQLVQELMGTIYDFAAQI
jgi:hypothetical protein